jgi:ParB/RepB/Spo0J family partition protein
VSNQKNRFPDFSAMPPDPTLKVLGMRPRSNPGEAGDAGPVTFPGRLAAETNKSFQAKIAQLEERLSTGDIIVRLDPKTVGHTDFANRDPRSLAADDPELQHLVWLIQTEGQSQPARVRPAASGSKVQHEVVFGHRRTAACRILDARTEGGWPLLAIIDSKAVDSQYLAKLMHSENDGHRPLSPYEYGRMYKSWLDAGWYENQQAIAELVDRDQTTVSAYIRVAELPPDILDAFNDRRTISLRWMQGLAKALKADHERCVSIARSIVSRTPRPGPQEVHRELTSLGADNKVPTSRRDNVMVGNRVACRISHREDEIALKFFPIVDRAAQKELAEDIKGWLESRLSESTKGPGT